MPVPLVFTAPQQIPPLTFTTPNFRENCPDAVVDPIDGGILVLKTGGSQIGLFLEKRDAAGFWSSSEVLIYPSQLLQPSASSRVAIDAGGNIMVATIANNAMRTWFIPRDGGATVSTDHGNTQIDEPFLDLTVAGQEIVLTYNIVRPSNGYYDMEYKVWDTATKTWGGAVNLGHPIDDVPGTARGIFEGSVDRSVLDGKFHAAVVAKIGGGAFNGAIWYKWFDPSAVTEGTWTLVRDPGAFPIQDRWPTIWASNLTPDRIYISVWRNDGTSPKPSRGDLLIGDGATWSATQFSAATDRAAQFPRSIIDYDDSIYFLWSEYNTSTSKMGLWARGCAPIQNLTALWGDTWVINPAVAFAATWSSDATVAVEPPEEEVLRFAPGVGGVLSNTSTLLNDFPSGQSWLKWEGV
jgi:hypothetical protein